MSNNSYSSGPNSSNMFKRSGSNITEDYIPEESAPSFLAGGMPSLLHQEYQYGPREVLPEPYESYVAAGSHSGIRPVQRSSTDMENRSSGLYQTSSKAPELDRVVHENASKNVLDSGAQYGDIKAPGHSSLGRENNSNPSGGEASSAGGEINQADYVGISLVGKKFKEVNPTAYYVEKDDDLNQFM